LYVVFICLLILVSYYIGNKDELVQTIKDMHIDFIIFLSRKLTPSDFEFIDGVFFRDISVPTIANKIVVAVKIPDPVFPETIEVSTVLIHEFKPARPLSVQLMSVIMKMFEKRDRRIAHAHKEVNEEIKNYNKYKRSYFLSVDFFRMLEDDPLNDALVDESYFPTKRYYPISLITNIIFINDIL